MGYLSIFELLLKHGAKWTIKAEGETVEEACEGAFLVALDNFRK